MQILVTGANGQLGSELRNLSSEYPDLNFYFTDVEEIDITNPDSINEFITGKNIDYIINCAAYTAVDKAEDNKNDAFLINQTAVKNLAEISDKIDCKFIHISTDYVFDGTNHFPYSENLNTNPFSVYGESKRKGEEEILNNPVKAIIIRTSWLYSQFGYNFVKTIARLGNERESLNVVFDQIGTPTNAYDLALAIIKIIELPDNDIFFKNKEIYHFSNEGVCSWYDFAKKIIEIKKLNCKINPIESKDFPTPTKRPFYSVFNKSKIKKSFHLEIPHWEDSLKIMLENI